MDKVRFGIVGLGIRGSDQAKYFLENKVERGELTAVCDINPAMLADYDCAKFASSEEMIRSGLVDAVFVATPHYAHTTIGIDALKNGKHVLVEKPISVHKADAERLIAAHYDHPNQVFAAMFNQRTNPQYQKVREIVQSGQLGEIRRTNWIITNWFRSDAYYASGGWRATWEGEGGGVLLNQCPHNLDLFQWMVGVPSKVTANCYFGKYHNIEVEDEVTAFFEYPNGATGVFITTTGETPGTNRLEIVGDKGKLVVEGGSTISLELNEVPMDVFRRDTPTPFGRPKTHVETIAVEGRGGAHLEICQNFVNAILDGTPLIAPAEEGIRSVEMANAMLLSTWLDQPVEIPLDGEVYEDQLMLRISESKKRG